MLHKLKYGHRGGNHPILNTKTNEIFITAQNHSYAVDAATLPYGAEAVFINLNDNTVEGIVSEKYNVKTVQFHPELTVGPYDGNKVIVDWIEELEQSKKTLV